MEEKKLTDEEIVKAYEYCVVQSGNCDGCLYDGFGCPVKGKDVVEAFYRLQDEKQKVIQDYYSERQTCDEQKDIIAKQKAEIERLTEENEYLDMVAKQALADYQNAQVQVDELKNYAERLFEENQDHYNKLQNANLYIEKHEPIWKRNTEQAVKYTAKECYEIFKFYVKNCYDIPLDLVARDIKEKTGVEVE